MEIIYKHISELTYEEILEIYNLRQQVFMLEQKIYVEDIDQYDYDSYHCYIKINNKIVSYLRVIKKDDEVFIGRLLTVKSERKKGLAKLLVNFVKNKYDVIKVSSQVNVISFYKELGFKEIKNRYKEAGIFHQLMIYIK
ncbi:MAG: GNAT family N-acetyltransferase [Acholeplasmataceae bacterium]